MVGLKHCQLCLPQKKKTDDGYQRINIKHAAVDVTEKHDFGVGIIEKG